MTKDQARNLLLQAQKDFDLTPGEFGAILLGHAKGYETYKHWVSEGLHSRLPTKSVIAHLKTLYSIYEKWPDAVRKDLKIRAILLLKGIE